MPDGDADTILRGLESAPDWIRLGKGEEGMRQAINAAFAGRLVLAGATSEDYGQTHGHVAVLLPRLAGPHNAPLMYGGGSPAATSAGTKTIRQVFRPSRLSVVRFFKHSKVALGPYD